MRLLIFLLISVNCLAQNIVNPFWNALDNSMNTNTNQQQPWLIIGDGIAQGISESSEVSPAMTYSNIVYEWDNIGADVQAVSGDLYNSTSGSPWVNFALNYYYRTGLKIVWINRAVPASTIGANTTSANNDWLSTGDNWTSTNVFSPVSACFGALGVQKLRGVIIHMGTNDAAQANTITDVQTALQALIVLIQDKYKDVPIYLINIGRISAGVTSRVTDIRGYIDALPAAYNKVYVIAKPGDAPFADWMYQGTGPTWKQFMNEAVGAAAVNGLVTQNLIRSAPPLTFATNTNDVIARFSSLPTDYQYAVNEWVQYATDQSIFANFDTFYCGLMDTEANSKQDWLRGSAQLSLVNGATWTQGQGFFMDGTNDYLDLNFNDGTDYVAGGLNDNFWLSMPMRVYTTGGAATNTLGGFRSATTANRINFDQTTVGIRAWNYTSTQFGENAQYFTPAWQYTVRRFTSASCNWTVNGTIIGTNTQASSALAGVTEFAGAFNNNGTPQSFLSFDFGLRLRGKNSLVSNFYRKNRCLLATLMVAHL